MIHWQVRRLFATYLGGSADDSPAGIALDSNGNIYIAGSTDSADFPVTLGAFQTTLGGGSDTSQLRIGPRPAASGGANPTDAFLLKIGPNSAPAVSVDSQRPAVHSVQAVSSTSPRRRFYCSNMGSSALSISSITSQRRLCGDERLRKQRASCWQLHVVRDFYPHRSWDSATGSILIQDDAAGSPHLINLTGTGSGPLATLTPANLTFPGQQVGSSSAAQTATLTNSGNAALSISNLPVTGDYRADQQLSHYVGGRLQLHVQHYVHADRSRHPNQGP